MATISTIGIGTDTQIIDLKTGKLTRQGLLLFQAIQEISPQVNTNTDALASHVAQNAASGTRGHVLLSSLVSNATASTVSVDSADATDSASNITLSNEIKADVNQLVTDVNAIATQLNALFAAMKTAGQMSST